MIVVEICCFPVGNLLGEWSFAYSLTKYVVDCIVVPFCGRTVPFLGSAVYLASANKMWAEVTYASAK